MLHQNYNLKRIRERIKKNGLSCLLKNKQYLLRQTYFSTMKTYLLCLIIHTCCIIPAVYPQQQIQGGLYIGGINYEGDLAPSSFILSFSETHLDFGAFVYLKTNNWLALKINYHHGSISGSDAHAHDEGRYNRNLHFWSPLDELSVSGAFFYAPKYHPRRIIKPFLTMGIGAFRFNPQAELNGKWYELQPLSTEGQGLKNFPERKPYKRVQICFPLGAGIQIALSKRTELSFELSLRKTLTDYLDDVSTTYVPLEDLSKEKGDVAVLLSNRTLSKNAKLDSYNQMGRGDSKNKDWYIIGSVGIIANIVGNNKRDNFFKKKHRYSNCKKLFRKKK